jgi:tubulin-specific chaperone A
LIGLLAKFIGATEDADGNTTAWKHFSIYCQSSCDSHGCYDYQCRLAKLVALWTTRSADANLLYVVGAKARAFADGVGIVVTQAYAIATMLMTGNVVGATQAFRVMTATMMTTLGVLL